MCVVRCLDECEHSLCVDSTNMQKCIVQCLDECKCLACLRSCWTSASASRAFDLVGRVQVRRVHLVLIDGSECVACFCLMMG